MKTLGGMATALACTGAMLAMPSAASAAGPENRVFGPSFVYNDTYSKVLTSVTVRSTEHSTSITLEAHDFPRSAYGHTFGAHVHVNECGDKPDDAGPHYQHAKTGPMKDREFWLDLTVDQKGRAVTRAERPWAVTPGTRSVVIHTEHTNAMTGKAGDPIACTTVPFSTEDGGGDRAKNGFTAESSQEETQQEADKTEQSEETYAENEGAKEEKTEEQGSEDKAAKDEHAEGEHAEGEHAEEARSEEGAKEENSTEGRSEEAHGEHEGDKGEHSEEQGSEEGAYKEENSTEGRSEEARSENEDPKGEQSKEGGSDNEALYRMYPALKYLRAWFEYLQQYQNSNQAHSEEKHEH